MNVSKVKGVLKVHSCINILLTMTKNAFQIYATNIPKDSTIAFNGVFF